MIGPIGGMPLGFTICWPEARAFHTWSPKPPSKAPSRKTTNTRAAASPRVLLSAMATFRYHHQNLIAVGRKICRIRGEDISCLYRTYRRYAGLRMMCPARSVGDQNSERESRRRRKSPRERYKGLPENRALAGARSFGRVNPRHDHARKSWPRVGRRLRNAQQTHAGSGILDRLAASGAILPVLRWDVCPSAFQLAAEVIFEQRLVLRTRCVLNSRVHFHDLPLPLRPHSGARSAGRNGPASISFHDSAARTEQSHFHRIHIELEYLC